VEAFLSEALQRIGALPGVDRVALVSSPPLSRRVMSTGVVIASGTNSGQRDSAICYVASGPYFDVFRIPINSGRAFSSAEASASVPIALVNRSFERQYFGGNALGQQIKTSFTGGTALEVVGVTEDLHEIGLDMAPLPTIYLPFSRLLGSYEVTLGRSMSVVARTRSGTGLLSTAVMREVAALDPEQAAGDILPMPALVATTVERQRFLAQLFVAFSLVAMSLTAAGVLGLVEHTTQSREHEMALRSALGAPPCGLISMLLWKTYSPVLLGLAIGLVGAAILGRFLQSLLFETPPLDIIATVGVAGGLAAISLAAAIRPTLRAIRVQPWAALRHE
jgi:ABC-type antimicrobial peptide transport system permease subunit